MSKNDDMSWNFIVLCTSKRISDISIWFLRGKKKIWKKKSQKKFSWKKLICEKLPITSQKMMICHKTSMSGVYENVF